MISEQDIKQVAIYLRVSRDETDAGIEEVLSSHRNKLIELCKQRKWKFTIYEEIASSQDMDRPQLNAMLDEIKNKTFEAVVVHAVDRLSREKLSAAYIQNVLRQNDVFLVTPEKTFNWSSDDDNLLIDMLELVAKAEYRNTRRRMMNGKLSAVKQGFFAHGVAPLGYSRDPNTKKLAPNENKIHIEFIFNSIAEGKSISEVYGQLNEIGIKTRDNSIFRYNTIERIIKNPVYIGHLVYNKHDGRRKLRPESEWKYAENAHEAIITKEVWKKANQVIETYRFSKPRAKNRIYPTTKLIFCGNCGKVQGTHLAHTKKYYLKSCVCKNRTFKYEPILKIIKERVSNHIPVIVEQIEAIEQNQNGPKDEYQKEQMQKQIDVAQKAIIKARVGYEEDVYTLAEFKETKAKRDKEIMELEHSLRQMERTDPKDKIADLKEIKNQVEYLLQNWECLDGEGLTDEEINRALHFIIDRIEWKFAKGDEVPELKIKWK